MMQTMTLKRRVDGDDDPALHTGLPYKEIDVLGSEFLTARGLRALNGSSIRVASFVGCHALDDDALKVISSWPLLETLDLSGDSEVTDRGVVLLARCQQLRSLNLSWVYAVSDGAMPALRGLERLRSLNLTSCNISGRGVETIAAFTALEWLALPLFPSLDDTAIEKLAATRSPIHTLAFGGDRITPRGFEHLAKLRTLKRVVLGLHDRSFTNDAFAAATAPGVDLSFMA
jgi:hypothetical protein